MIKRIRIKALSGSEPHCSHLKIHCELQLTSSNTSLEHDVIPLNVHTVHTVHCEFQLTSSRSPLEHDVIPFDASVNKFDILFNGVPNASTVFSCQNTMKHFVNNSF